MNQGKSCRSKRLEQRQGRKLLPSLNLFFRIVFVVHNREIVSCVTACGGAAELRGLSEGLKTQKAELLSWSQFPGFPETSGRRCCLISGTWLPLG